MTSNLKQDLLVELGTEELPPKNLKAMIESFESGFVNALNTAQFAFDSIESFATPRRLALKVNGLAAHQPPQKIEKRGPSLKAALDSNGEPTRAVKGFMSSVGISDIAQLQQVETEKGVWLVYRDEKPGASLESTIQELLEKSLATLPIERKMRWGDSRVEFVRPVHWLVLLYGQNIIPAKLFGITSGRTSRGHRFMSSGDIKIDSPAVYASELTKAHVVANFGERRCLITDQLENIGKAEQANVEIDEALLDEVTALVEWPVALMGQFDADFLAVPEEALISAMKEHQRYFHMTDLKGKMLPRFITISNIESKNPETVIRGNERVILPRLTDARFFFEKDQQYTLESKLERLGHVVFQAELGSYRDKTSRLEILSHFIASAIGADAAAAARSARLCKSDLVSDMVNEFPDLQGTMGGYYAIHDGESETVAAGIREHYYPASSGGDLPKSLESMSVAIADKLDTLVGMFGIGQPPTGSKDPFALRRQTIGIIRMCIEGELDLSLNNLIDKSIEIHGKPFDASPIKEYLAERLKNWYQDRGVQFDSVEAVTHANDWQANLNVSNNTIKALEAFRNTEDAVALVAANKRVANILKKTGSLQEREVDPGLFKEQAEHDLFAAITHTEQSIGSLNEDSKRLTALGGLRSMIDAYFDQVMVMTEEDTLRENRLATLSRMRSLFLRVADISLLQQ